MSALEPTAPPPVLRPQVGLMLSIGEPPTEARPYPKKLDHFRPKPGAEDQYADAAQRFREVYGDEPRVLNILLLSNAIGDVLDVRYKAWGQSGLKAVGDTNFAEYPARLAQHDPGPDWLTAFPEKEPAPRRGRVDGVNDKNAVVLGLKVYGVLRFALEGVTGLTTLAEISTTSRRSMLNLVAGIEQVLLLTGNQLAGIPLELVVRPARTRYFDEKAKKRATTSFYELVLQAPGAIDEFFDAAAKRRAQMNAGRPAVELPPFNAFDLDRDEELLALEEKVRSLPVPTDPDVAVREEPAAEGPSEAQLNRIAGLEEKYGGVLETFLVGAFNARSVVDLSGAQAAQYEAALTRLLESSSESEEASGAGEDDPEGDSQFSFASLMPTEFRKTEPHS